MQEGCQFDKALYSVDIQARQTHEQEISTVPNAKTSRTAPKVNAVDLARSFILKAGANNAG
jgi:hypothetical protein